LAARYRVGQDAQNALRDAGRAISESENKARQSLKATLATSAEPGKQIATFTARSTSFSEEDYTVTLNEGIVKWREPRYIGGPIDGAIPVREIVNAVAGKDEFPASKVLNPDRPMLKTATISYRTKG
jgi:hypothetical protein